MAAGINDQFKKAYNSGNPNVARVTVTRTAGGTSLTCDNLAGWPTSTAVDFSTYRLNTSGAVVAGTQIDWKGIVAGNTIGTLTRITGATDAGSVIGDVVEMNPTGNWATDLVTGILTSIKQDGTMIASLPLTTPKITTSINDANGNEVIKTPATASAVNEVTITNAATTGIPTVSATGDDTNISLALTPKGTGVAYIDSLYTWQRGTGTWTYASATTFTVPQADANLIRKGTKLWFTQTTSKYFYVLSISGTTVTIMPTSDYTLANAVITAPYFSNAATPIGFPVWFSYTPTFTNMSGGTLGYSKYTYSDGIIFGKFLYTLAGAGISGAVSFTPPVTIASSIYTTDSLMQGKASLLDSGAALYEGGVKFLTTTSVEVRVQNASATYVQSTSLSSTVPLTWGNLDSVLAEYYYEAA